jgi:hypothetical protein
MKIKNSILVFCIPFLIGLFFSFMVKSQESFPSEDNECYSAEKFEIGSDYKRCGICLIILNRKGIGPTLGNCPIIIE